MYFHWISCFHYQRSHFKSYTSLCIILHKVNLWNMCWKINFFFKVKRIQSNYSSKRALCLYKRALLFDKRELGEYSRAGKGRITLVGSCFWYLQFKLRKKFFFSKKAIFSKFFDSWKLNHSEIGPSNSLQLVLLSHFFPFSMILSNYPSSCIYL